MLVDKVCGEAGAAAGAAAASSAYADGMAPKAEANKAASIADFDKCFIIPLKLMKINNIYPH
jgi:hypothetical protein